MPNKIFIGWRSSTSDLRNACTIMGKCIQFIHDAYEYLFNILANQAVDCFGSIPRILVAETIVLPTWCFVAHSRAVYQMCIY